MTQADQIHQSGAYRRYWIQLYEEEEKLAVHTNTLNITVTSVKTLAFDTTSTPGHPPPHTHSIWHKQTDRREPDVTPLQSRNHDAHGGAELAGALRDRGEWRVGREQERHPVGPSLQRERRQRRRHEEAGAQDQ